MLAYPLGVEVGQDIRLPVPGVVLQKAPQAACAGVEGCVEKGGCVSGEGGVVYTHIQPPSQTNEGNGPINQTKTKTTDPPARIRATPA